MNIQSFTASEAARNFGPLLDEAQKRPVEIKKQGRPFAFVVSADFFQEIEDAYWVSKAIEAEKEGFLGPDESEKAIQRIRNKHAKNRQKQAGR